MLRCDLTDVILHLLRHRKNILRFKFIDYPSIENVRNALEILEEKGCISIHLNKQRVEYGSTDLSEQFSPDDLEIKISRYGERISYHPFTAVLSHFYEQCMREEVGYYGSLLLGLISQDNLGQIDTSISYLVDVAERYKESDNRKGFISRNGLSEKMMDTSMLIFKVLNKKKDGGNIETVERVFSRCFSHNLCIRNSDGSYTLEKTGTKIYIHPMNAFFKRHCKRIVVMDILQTSKPYAQVVGRFFPIQKSG
jgi:ATP-dependent RNA helicase DHX8/PRP22